MAVRIEKDTLVSEPTNDPNIFKVTVDATKDGVEKQDPKIHRVTVFWNKNTSPDTIRALVSKEIPDTTVQDTLRAAIGETVIKIKGTVGDIIDTK